MKSKKEIDMITDTLIDYGITIAISGAILKMLSDAYKENPNMFWAYKRSKYRNLEYNCRM